jgi:GNAT superfamily N-acetyltransferase
VTTRCAQTAIGGEHALCTRARDFDEREACSPFMMRIAMKTSSVTVRMATIDDADALARLATALGYSTTTTAMEERLLTLRYDDDHAVFVAVEGGEVRGFAHIAVRASLLSDLTLEVLALVVDERARGRGLGRALQNAIEAEGRSRGLDEVRVSSNIARERAHRFYEANGYARVKVQVVLKRAL